MTMKPAVTRSRPNYVVCPEWFHLQVERRITHSYLSNGGGSGGAA
ncbi:MAG TPA: hypothetical protein VF168_08435 [Trueperaceae bacterium]